MLPLSRTALLLAILVATPLAGQKKPSSEDPPTGAGKATTMQSGESRAELRKKRQDSRDERKHKQLKQKMATKGREMALKSHMRPLFSTTPRRVAPGESGVLHITFALIGHSILRSPSHLQLAYVPQQGPFRFDVWALDPPAPATLDTLFRGEPVYDNTAQVSVPFTVSPNARHKSYDVRFKVVAEITESTSGLLHGPYEMHVDGTVEVGTPVPEVDVAETATSALVPEARFAGPADVAPRTDSVRPADTVRRPPDDWAPALITADRDSAVESAAKVVDDAADADAGQVVVAEYSGESDGGLLLWLGGGGVLAVLFLLVLARRR